MTPVESPPASGRAVVWLLLLSVVAAIGITAVLTWPVLQRADERRDLKEEAMRPPGVGDAPTPGPTAPSTPPR